MQKAVYYILTELKLKRIFLALYCVNTNPPEEGVKVLLSEKGLSKLPDVGPNIFKKSNIDRCMERPSATFCSEKYTVYFRGFLLCRIFSILLT